MRKPSVLLTVLAITAPMMTAEAQDSREFRVDPDASWIRILAWPDGPLKRFGHHHVISHHGIAGTVMVAPDPLDSTIVLEIAVNDLTVDDAAQRALEGEEFEDEVPQKDIDGTRGNMLGEDLLHGEAHPMVRLQSAAIEGSLADARIVMTVTMKGVDQTVSFPASIELSDDAFTARGEIELTHPEVGLEQFTAMGGALSVRDLLVFKYEIAGTPAADE